MNKKNAIFIHSLFRTGSTYIWNKFRQSGAFHCYYEPFHQELAFLTTENQERWKSTVVGAASMGHPLLDREYMHEYRHLLRPGSKGIPFFKKSFSFDDFCNHGSNPDQKRYVDFLLENCGEKKPLLQFSRSALRVGWFKKNYPGVFHVYLLRDPRQQFRSFLQVKEKGGLDIFLVMNLLTAGVNMKKCQAFKDLSRRLPLFEYHAAEFRQEEEFYRKLQPVYSLAEQYAVHFCIWFAALLENLAHADMILDIDLLSDNDGYRSQALRRLAGVAGAALDLSDARIQRTAESFLPEAELSRSENDIRAMLLRRIGRKLAVEMAERLDSETMVPDTPRPGLWLESRRRRMPAVDVRRALIAKQEAVSQKFSARLMELKSAVEAGRIEVQFKRGANAKGLKDLLKKHDALRAESQALTDLLNIPPGKSSCRRSVPHRVRSWFAPAGRGGASAPAEEMTGLRGGLRLAGVQKKTRPGLPLVTVVTVVLNETQNLENTLASILRQTYANIEIIVVDGGSAQPTLDVIRKFADKIDYWLSEPDRGIFAAMNKGIALASGAWINFLNCGDRFYRDDTLETVFKKENKNVDFIYGHTDFQGGDFHGVVKAWDFNILWKTMIFTHQSLFSRSAVLKERNFNTDFRICADFDLIFNAWVRGLKFHNCDIVIASFHPGFSDVSRARMAWEKWRVVKAHRSDPAFHWFYLSLFGKRLFRDIQRRLSGKPVKQKAP